MWKNSLTVADVSVTRSEYNHALKVFTELYLTTEVIVTSAFGKRM